MITTAPTAIITVILIALFSWLPVLLVGVDEVEGGKAWFGNEVFVDLSKSNELTQV